MWFTTVQIGPRTIGLMVSEFHWMWGIEWTFFCLEITSGYAFYRYGKRLDDTRRADQGRGIGAVDRDLGCDLRDLFGGRDPLALYRLRDPLDGERVEHLHVAVARAGLAYGDAHVFQTRGVEQGRQHLADVGIAAPLANGFAIERDPALERG